MTPCSAMSEHQPRRIEAAHQHDGSAHAVQPDHVVAGDVAQRERRAEDVVGVAPGGAVNVASTAASRLAWVSIASFGVAGRAARADEPHHVVGGEPTPAGVGSLAARDRRTTGRLHLVEPDDHLDAGGARCGDVQPCEQLGFGDQHPRAGARQAAEPFVGMQPLVERDEHASRRRHRVVALDVLGPVLRQDRDPIARVASCAAIPAATACTRADSSANVCAPASVTSAT